MEKQNLIGMSLKELETFVESLGEKKYRGTQLYSWIYGKGAETFDEMSNISEEFRILLNSVATLGHLRLDSSNTSHDGTTKFLFQLSDGLAIESVLIPPDRKSPHAESRLTLCLSTQVGCPLDCKFCATGTMGFSRNLSAGEIISQVLQVQRLSRRRITNLVYMGMGEPMLNYDNVMKSVDIITDDGALNIGSRHITISTAGYADKIRQMADENRKVKLALSLHSLDNEKRATLMPITKKFAVADLIEALEYYYRKTRNRPTFEYILFEGFNDTESDIRRFELLARRIPSKVNIIPFHSIEFTHPSGFAATLKPTPRSRTEAFADRLRKANITVMIRASSGEDINAACGQLAIEGTKKKRKADLPPYDSPPGQIAVSSP
ncbi:MAG TPA: 23S rRNA (adenine(2503)-C(2))-methyltransferase RlmN [Bacteroidota bacterium]|nr:23S rRNA (adenine(2503)-C(2))-methyltransferase RlmN [Bacteroidota bacterium]